MQRHLARPWRQPIHKATQDIWNRLKAEAGFSADTAFVLDSGCGTGHSTRQLAAQHPGLVVLGIDQSRSRLSKSGVIDGLLVDGNVLLLRAELSSVWRLMLAEGIQPRTHYLLYPNPWPKSGQLKRRWHGHPVFPSLLALGGDLEMHCNWRIYAQEFAAAASQVSGQMIESMPFKAGQCLSPFEQKYVQRGHRLFTVRIPASVLTSHPGP